MVGGDPTSTPSTSMDTSEPSSTRQEEEEQSGSECAEVEEGTPESLDACSHKLVSSQEEGSQSWRPVLGEGQTSEEVPDATLRSQPSLLTPAERHQRIRKRPRRSKEDMLHEVMQHSSNENQKVQEWQESERRIRQQNEERRHKSAVLWQQSTGSADKHNGAPSRLHPGTRSHAGRALLCPPALAALVPKLFLLCPHFTSNSLSPTSGFLPPPAASNTCSFTTQP
ncbi:uncharacterized protein LOC120402156 [Mauremys reevesii]|uniref:uncharacterized protein LOC120402156 n=1 Tax=Mauremys reevesii TaxID=260615 RepID=UPI00193F439B|nr:uncharacterized protein LOC120402156 [Mauremys reevesii]